MPRLPYAARVLVLLTLCLAARPASAQERFVDSGTKVLLLYGYTSVERGDECHAPMSSPLAVGAVAVQAPISSPLEGRVLLAVNGGGRTWPTPPPPPIGLPPTVDVIMRSGISWSLALDLVLPLPLGERLLLEPFAGAGVNRLEAGDFADEGNAVVYALDESLDPAVFYGAGLTLGVSPRLGVQVQARATSVFAGEQTFRLEDRPAIVRDVGTLSWFDVMAGVVLRL